MAVDPALPRQRLAGETDDAPEEERPDGQSEGDQRERSEVVDSELDEQVTRAPHEPETEEDQPVDAVRSGAHRGMIAVIGLSG